MDRISWSQMGQDILADYFLTKLRGKGNNDSGTYVDVGACYPKVASNTYYFYERGWRGICIDADPNRRAAFLHRRPEDIFLTEGVSDAEGEMTFYTYTNPQWNAFSPERRDKKSSAFVAEIKVPTRHLSSMLDEHLHGRSIELMSVDTEGHELNVLKSLDFTRHRPTLIVIESIMPPERCGRDAALAYAKEQGYKLVAHTGHDAFLMDQSPRP